MGPAMLLLMKAKQSYNIRTSWFSQIIKLLTTITTYLSWFIFLKIFIEQKVYYSMYKEKLQTCPNSSYICIFSYLANQFKRNHSTVLFPVYLTNRRKRSICFVFIQMCQTNWIIKSVTAFAFWCTHQLYSNKAISIRLSNQWK